MLLENRGDTVTQTLSFQEVRLDVQLEKQKKACADAMCMIQNKGTKVAEFLRDHVTYKDKRKR